MKNYLTLSIFLFVAVCGLNAQTIDELKTKKAELEAQQKEKQAEADAFNGDIAELAKQIEILTPWQTGLSGLVGLNFGNSNNWQANANPNSSSSVLNLGVNAFANNIKEKSFWRNTLTANLSWQGLDNDTEDDDEGTGFLADRNVDVLILSSLYGYRLNKDIALSALGDLNTSIFNFLEPGTLDVGIGATWTPSAIPNLVVVVHPLTMNFAFSGVDGVESQNDLGLKLKATYQKEFPLGIVWSSNLSSFIPYSGTKYDVTFVDDAGVEQTGEETLFNYTWINSLNIADVWKGVGVGFTFGLRDARFEYPPSVQTYSAVGITYGF